MLIFDGLIFGGAYIRRGLYSEGLIYGGKFPFQNRLDIIIGAIFGSAIFQCANDNIGTLTRN